MNKRQLIKNIGTAIAAVAAFPAAALAAGGFHPAARRPLVFGASLGLDVGELININGDCCRVTQISTEGREITIFCVQEPIAACGERDA